jgi:diaminopimelate decarboxylase
MADLSLLPPSAAVDGDDLRIAGVSLRHLAREFGTPAYVLDEDYLRARARQYVSSLTSRHPRSRVCFAAKAFPSASVIGVLAEEGLGCDVVGAGELRLALAGGVDPARIVMHGNAKSDDDIQAALDARIGYIVVDGFDDIDRISRLARTRTPVLLRISPGIDSATHEALATGGAGSKFGVPADQAPAAIELMRDDPLIDLQGLHAHIGSQITDLAHFEAEVAALASLGHGALHLPPAEGGQPPGAPRFGVYDLGGGLGVRYVPEDAAPDIDQYAARLTAAARRYLGEDIEILVEPGRSVVGPAGLTLYRVLTRKQSQRLHVAVDGGMGDNLEHSLYGQRFAPLVVGRWNEAAEVADLVGRHCEEGDVISRDVTLASPQLGDLIVVPVTGAYCFTMSNNYNANLRPPVVLCAGGVARLAVRRETPDDLMAREVLVRSQR